jgi:hypothetical protein
LLVAGVNMRVTQESPMLSMQYHLLLLHSMAAGCPQHLPTPHLLGFIAPCAGPLLESALLVVKWGGVLTHAGRHQAENLGG